MSRAVPRFKRVNPSLPAVGTGTGVVMYAIQGLLENQMTLNTFMYSSAVPAPTPTQLATLLQNISTQLLTKYLACVSADWSVTQELLKVVHRNDISGQLLITHQGNVGGRTAGHLPTENAIVILRQTATKGQHGRGRLSLPAVALADVTASRITAAALITALNTFIGATGMLATVSDGVNSWYPSLGQRSNSSPRLIVGTAALTGTTYPTLLGTIRRRKIGRGK